MNEEPKNWRTSLREELAKLPADFRQAKRAADEVSRAFHAELAAALAPGLNAYLRDKQPTTYADRREFAICCNHELRELRLAIRCPKTGAPGILFADVDARHPDSPKSRFRIAIHDPISGRQRKTFSSEQLPELALMEEPIRREPLAKWRPTSDEGSRGKS